ncbi:hypothetical protein PFFVO_03248 [Plasmodium falciparum Vietnam Oak-Knoll (FVO)]|uniref:Surface antigen n=1 Tax=Plasmodium falciparum Vietnam Oak-Knoll (FVO) TaxID=1036723 RepID=A0A024V5U8_PLAFA|nr:hypothetical protein PFFVO_03248 [Plasmodium falciparum Vietnam Oak-Knoll (FVO)]
MIPCFSIIYNQRNHKSTTHHTLKIPITRLLCECDLYTPNYDNHPQMKEVMQQFEDRTTQRFHEYDERMKTTRQKCRDQCDKEIQKIILKDKLEKQMALQLATLDTKITTDNIPTCICKKSVAHKMEKGCLRCGGVLGGGIAPTFGLIGSVAINMWKTTEIAAATKAAIAAGESAGKIAGEAAGVAKVIELIELTFKVQNIAVQSFESFFTAPSYKNVASITEALFNEYADICLPIFTDSGTVPGVRYNISSPICTSVEKGMVARVGIGGSPKNFIKTTVEEAVAKGTQAAETEATQVAAAEKAAVLETSKKAIETTIYNLYSAIGYSITAILIIVLIMKKKNEEKTSIYKIIKRIDM